MKRIKELTLSTILALGLITYAHAQGTGGDKGADDKGNDSGDAKTEKVVDFSKASYNFGKVKVETSKKATFAITNSGGATLQIESVTGTNNAEFVIEPPKENAVPSGGSVPMTVTFTPKSNGKKGTKITIKNNDEDEQNFQFVIIGTGTGGPEIGLSVDPNSGPEIDVLVKKSEGDDS